VADIYRRYKQIQHLKKINIARKINSFIINAIIKIFSANLIYALQLQLSIVLRQEFTPKYVQNYFY